MSAEPNEMENGQNSEALNATMLSINDVVAQIARYEQLRNTVASRAGLVLTANTVLLAGIAFAATSSLLSDAQTNHELEFRAILAGTVGDEGVPVQQRVSGPRGSMPKQRRDHSGAG